MRLSFLGRLDMLTVSARPHIVGFAGEVQ